MDQFSTASTISCSLSSSLGARSLFSIAGFSAKWHKSEFRPLDVMYIGYSNGDSRYHYGTQAAMFLKLERVLPLLFWKHGPAGDWIVKTRYFGWSNLYTSCWLWFTEVVIMCYSRAWTLRIIFSHIYGSILNCPLLTAFNSKNQVWAYFDKGQKEGKENKW